MFHALVLHDDEQGFRTSIETMNVEDLPSDGDVLVEVRYSSLNYKDALAVTNQGKIVRASFPFVPGIDLVGRVIESDSDRFNSGDIVVGTGGGLGESYWGGYAGMQRIPSDWLVPLPGLLSDREAMIIGTAGFTAGLALLTLEKHGIRTESGEVLVTGATGGVGSFAVLLLSKAGYRVTASSGKPDALEYLRSIGAEEVIHRDVLSRGAAKPMDSARWAGAVDSVGGSTLETIISQTARHGCIAVCGNAGGAELHTSVYPFILRGVNLCGIDSNTCPVDDRKIVWERIASLVSSSELESMSTVISLSEIEAQSSRLLAGDIKGRILVEL